MPRPATKAELTTGLADLRTELAGKPNRAEIWGAVAAMTGGFAVILTALTWFQTWLPHH